MSERKRVRIVSDDGDFFKSRVIDMETGKTIPYVVSVDWHADAENLPTATIRTLFAEIDVTTGAEVITICPECGGEGAIEEIVWLRKENSRLRDENLVLKGQVERIARGGMS